MNEYLRNRYGDPCRGCGYDWSLPADEARAIVLAQADRADALLAAATGQERLPDLGWNVVAYVSHLVDNTRIWAERLVAVGPAVSYEEDDLAAVRGYVDLDLTGARWALRRATGDLEAALAIGSPIPHPEQGPLPIDDVLRVLGHEATHHLQDIERLVRG